MPDATHDEDNSGGTRLIAEKGEQMDPAVAGISVVSPDDDGAAERSALAEEDAAADPKPLTPVEGSEALDESEGQPS